MRDISQRTLKKLAGSLPDLYAAPSLRGVADRAMEIFGSLAPMTIASTAVFQQEPDGKVDASLFDSGKYQRSPEEIQYWTGIGVALADENMLLKTSPLVLAQRTFKASEIAGDALLLRTTLYHEFFKPLDAYRQLIVTVPLPGGFAYIGAYRGGTDFDDREYAVMDFLRPHICKLARRHVLAREDNLALSALEAGAEHRSIGIIAVDGTSLRIRRISATATSLFQWSGLRILQARLPGPVERWLIAQRKPERWMTGRTPDEFALPHAGGVLEIRFVENPSENELYIVAVAKVRESEPARLCALGLTKREAEVLHWIAEGKGSSEIATIIGAARGTVEKHAEKILQKLGVESRLAAAAEVRRWDLE